ncbi:lytic transglycosylase domain-containing protein [Clostridium mediterraneense]|uniref:lytic transglycosylase domain-containing protein n=1 Tax=Clostridium mediterraneense TaxID=1805472 RepID=UPI000834C40F|nr:lytic transglycosylase domain-containing protein [Clostridium mediterraneense]
MKIEGLGSEQIAAFMLLSQMKSSSKESSPIFDIVMHSVLSSMTNSNNSTESSNLSDLKKEENNEVILKPLNPSLTSQENKVNVESNINVETKIESNNNITLTEQRINVAIENASKKYRIDKGIIRAIIKAESNFNPSVTSSAGAQGLMQIMPANFSFLGISNGYDIEQNINGGAKLLRNYLDRYNGNLEMALMAYNGGPGTMERRGVKSASDLYKMPKETQNYVPKVLKYYRDRV